MTVGLNGGAVEIDLCAGLLGCRVVGCGAVLRPWGSARERVVRGVGRLLPRRGRCRGCGRTQVLLPASVLLRRADAVTVIGAGLLAKASGLGHLRVAVLLQVPASTVRGWLRRIAMVAERVLAVLAAAAAQPGVEFAGPLRHLIRSQRWWRCSERWLLGWPAAWVSRARRGGWLRS
jgi:hypothetical protein